MHTYIFNKSMFSQIGMIMTSVYCKINREITLIHKDLYCYQMFLVNESNSNRIVDGRLNTDT